jgi:hypothetical protein
MGVLTIPLNETEEKTVSAVMLNYNIATKTGAMRHASSIILKLEKELEELRRDKKNLEIKVADYRRSSLDLLSGISGLCKLTEIKI